MKRAELESTTLNGIEEDLLEVLHLESIPPALHDRLQNRLHQYYRDIADIAVAYAADEARRIVRRAFEE